MVFVLTDDCQCGNLIQMSHIEEVAMANRNWRILFASSRATQPSVWTRKSFDAVHDAVTHEMQRHDASGRIDEELSALKYKIDSCLSKCERDLQEVRGGMCALCRSNAMYRCDVSIGFSVTCNFIYSNTA